MEKTFRLLSALLVLMALSSFGEGVIAQDRITYKTVKIGKQVWMAENLNVSEFRNGDPIQEAKTDEEWEKVGIAGKPAWCYYNNGPTNGEKYGKLYNWYAVNDPRGLAPSGWHLPSEDEWIELEMYFGLSKSDAYDENWRVTKDWRVTNEGIKLKASSGWEEGGNGTNSSGFAALPAGSRGYTGIFHDIGYVANFWSSSGGRGSARYRRLSYSYPGVGCSSGSMSYGFSVRCLKD